MPSRSRLNQNMKNAHEVDVCQRVREDNQLILVVDLVPMLLFGTDTTILNTFAWEFGIVLNCRVTLSSVSYLSVLFETDERVMFPSRLEVF